jgi:hypothetical protein
MAQWGRNDQAVTLSGAPDQPETSNGAPIGVYALVKGDQVNRVDGANAHYGDGSAGSRSLVDSQLFGNTTVGAFIPDMAVGVFGVDATEATAVSGGPIAEAYLTFAGSGYKSNAAVTITVTNGGTSGVVNAHAAAGRIDQIKIQTAGSGYITNPTITVADPDLLIFNGNTGVTPNGSIGAFVAYTSANSYLQVGDKVMYAGNATSTPVTLYDNRPYYISFANTSGFKLSDTPGGANINFAKASGDNTTAGGATIQGETATGYVVSGGNKGTGIAHAGWVVRREGTGGRAGRVQYETLVAMGSLGKQSAAYGTAATTADASDDSILPDA